LTVEQLEEMRRLQEVSDAMQRAQVSSLSSIVPISRDGALESAERLMEAGVTEDQIINDPVLFRMTGARNQEELARLLRGRMGPFPPPRGNSHARQ